MITGVIKNTVDKIWTDIWAGGITNPLTVIEQLTYLTFIRSLDEKEFEREEFASMTGKPGDFIFPQSEIGQSMRWSKFKNKDSREIFNLISTQVFPAVKKMKYGKLPDFDDNGEFVEIPDKSDGKQAQTAFTRYMDNAVFVIPNPQVLQKVITGLDDLYEHDIADLDMQGDLYEYMLGKLSTAGQNGQFRTPKHIREMMVELIAPTPEDLICDPACGTAGFLVSAAEYIRKHYENTMTEEDWQNFGSKTFTGYDTDQTMLRICLYHILTSEDFLHQKDKYSSGATQKAITNVGLSKITVNVPNISEQNKIADCLDKVDEAIKKCHRILKSLDLLVKARFVEMFGDPLRPNKSHILSEVALLERGKFSPRPRNDPRYYNGSYPFVQTGDIANCKHRLSNYHQTLNEYGIKVSKRFEAGTILIALVGATIGETAILQIPVYAPDSIIGITVKERKLNNVFLEMLLQFWRPELKRIAPEAARANINLEIVQNIPILDAPINLQEQFATFVEKIDKSRLAVKQVLEKAETLKKALMQEYFK